MSYLNTIIKVCRDQKKDGDVDSRFWPYCAMVDGQWFFYQLKGETSPTSTVTLASMGSMPRIGHLMPGYEMVNVMVGLSINRKRSKEFYHFLKKRVRKYYLENG